MSVKPDLQIQAYGKCILAGEYSVLEEEWALVFPLYQRFVELKYWKRKPAGPQTENSLAATQVLERALKYISRSKLEGRLQFSEHISVGAGMGSSAVFCVLIARCFYFLKWLKKEELFSFCHRLENYFHGRSSGVDIAAVLKGEPISYQLKNNLPQIQTFSPSWKPLLFLSHSGPGARTKENIQKFEIFHKKNPSKAHTLNKQMAQAVLKAKEGLTTKSEDKGLSLLKEALLIGKECFSKWDLINQNMEEHMRLLEKAGAIAVKPSGSGSGGSVLSLWSKAPPIHLSNQLISLF